MEAPGDKVYAGLDAIVYPNPTANNFSMIIQGDEQEKILMQVVDLQGRVIESKNVVAKSIIKFGDKYRPGTYFVRIMQNDNLMTIKLIKIGD